MIGNYCAGWLLDAHIGTPESNIVYEIRGFASNEERIPRDILL